MQSLEWNILGNHDALELRQANVNRIEMAFKCLRQQLQTAWLVAPTGQEERDQNGDYIDNKAQKSPNPGAMFVEWRCCPTDLSSLLDFSQILLR